MAGKEKSTFIKLINRYGIYALVLVCFVLACMVFLPVKKNSNDEKKDYVIRNSFESVNQENVTGSGNIFKMNENENITVLLRNYYSALMGREGLLLTRYVDDVKKLSDTTKKYYSNYVRRINNMSIYVTDGLLDNSYVVAVVGYQTLDGIESPVPFMDKFFILTDSEGNLYITTKEQSESVTVYNELMYEAESIVKLSGEVALEYDELLDKEPLLSKIVASLGDN